MTDEEKAFVRKAGLGIGLLVSGQRRVQLDLFNKLSPAEYAAFHSDPVITPVTAHLNGAVREILQEVGR